MANAKEAALAAIKGRINGNKAHGWGIDDAVEVILAVVANETGTDVKDLDGIRAIIREQCNTSAFRQKLESNEVLNKSTSKKKKVDSVLASLKTL